MTVISQEVLFFPAMKPDEAKANKTSEENS